MQSISTNNLFMHGHENWGQATLFAPTRKIEGTIAPLPLPRFRGLWVVTLSKQ